jgi:hypothetical protein
VVSTPPPLPRRTDWDLRNTAQATIETTDMIAM